MSEKVLKRFIILMVIFIAIVMIGSDFLRQMFTRPPGDMETELGSIRLEDKNYDEALTYYNKALEKSPNHRGALMGRALVYIKTKKYPKAISELDALIAFLKKSLKTDDTTGRGALAAAYANLGIVYDRMGQYKKALANYLLSLNTDEESVSGPGVVHKILHGSEGLSTVRDRAKYIHEQLQKPESERVMRRPELDAKQRMHKP